MAFGKGGGGGHSHRRRVQSCDRGQDAVKRSRHFLGVGQTVKQCAGALSTALLAIKRRGRSFCACAVNRWSRVKGKNPAWSSSQGRFSTVKNLDPGRSSGHGTYGSDPPLFGLVALWPYTKQVNQEAFYQSVSIQG